MCFGLDRLFPAGGRTVNTASIFGGITRDADGKVTGAKAMAFTYLLAQAPLYLLCLKLTVALAISYLLAAASTHICSLHHTRLQANESTAGNGGAKDAAEARADQLNT